MVSKPGRIFIVGCPRSGTTLLQSILAAHSEVVSVPETHFWPTLMRKRRFWWFVGAISPFARDKALCKLREIGLNEIEEVWPDSLLLQRVTDAFVTAMDKRAAQENARAWIEKTPRHLHFVSRIEKSIPGAQFIHMIRSGHQVIASLRQVTMRHPQAWSGERSVADCVERWVNDIRISFGLLGRGNHHAVYYDDLVNDPEIETQRLCRLLGLEWEPRMVERRGGGYRAIRGAESPWTESVEHPIASQGDRKYYEVLSESERAQVKEALEAEGLYRENLRGRLEPYLG